MSATTIGQESRSRVKNRGRPMNEDQSTTIKVSVMYPDGEGKTFDLDYYASTHLDIVNRVMEPSRLVPIWASDFGTVAVGCERVEHLVPPEFAPFSASQPYEVGYLIPLLGDDPKLIVDDRAGIILGEVVVAGST